MAGRFVRTFGAGNKRVPVDLDRQLKAIIGENVYYNGQLLKPEDLLNAFITATTSPVQSPASTSVSAKNTQTTQYRRGAVSARSPSTASTPGSTTTAASTGGRRYGYLRV